MGRPLKLQPPTAAERRRLREYADEAHSGPSQRRAEAVLLQAEGMSATDIARALGVHVNTIRADLHAFDQNRLEVLKQIASPGAPARLSEAQKADICQIADQEPGELGLSYGRWSLARLRAYLIRQRKVKAISRSHLRRILKRGASTGARGGRLPLCQRQHTIEKKQRNCRINREGRPKTCLPGVLPGLPWRQTRLFRSASPLPGICGRRPWRPCRAGG